MTVGTRAMQSARKMGGARGPGGGARAQAATAPVQQRVNEQDARVQDQHAEHGARGDGPSVHGLVLAPPPHAQRLPQLRLYLQTQLLLKLHSSEANDTFGLHGVFYGCRLVSQSTFLYSVLRLSSNDSFVVKFKLTVIQ